MSSCISTPKPLPLNAPVRPQTSQTGQTGQTARSLEGARLPGIPLRDGQQAKGLEQHLSGLIRDQLAGTHAEGSKKPEGTGQELGQVRGGDTGVAKGHQGEGSQHLHGNGHIKHHSEPAGIPAVEEPEPAICDGLPPVDSPALTPDSGGSINLQVKGLLQGPYNADTGLMSDALRELGLLPESQPYRGSGYNGNETASAATLATTGNNAPVDWVVIELRDKNNPDQIVSRQAALIQRDGDVADPDSNSSSLQFEGVPPGEYFVTLSHRNHLDVMTATPVTLGADNTLIDFTDPAMIGGQQATSTAAGASMLWAGDANANNTVIADGPDNDLNAILGTIITDAGNPGMAVDYAVSGYLNTDVNLDGVTSYTGANSDAGLISSNAANSGGNTSGSANHVLTGSVMAGIPRPDGTVQMSQALQDSFWF